MLSGRDVQKNIPRPNESDVHLDCSYQYRQLRNTFIYFHAFNGIQYKIDTERSRSLQYGYSIGYMNERQCPCSEELPLLEMVPLITLMVASRKISTRASNDTKVK